METSRPSTISGSGVVFGLGVLPLDLAIREGYSFPSWSGGEPVGHLDEKGVAGPSAEQLTHVSPERVGALERGRSLPALAPHQKQSRPGPILPAKHCVRPKLLKVESGGSIRDGRVGIRAIPLRVRVGPRFRDLTHVAVAPLGDKGRGVDL